MCRCFGGPQGQQQPKRAKSYKMFPHENEQGKCQKKDKIYTKWRNMKKIVMKLTIFYQLEAGLA